MKKNLAKKITLSILAGAVLMSSSVVWAETTVDVKDKTTNTTPWTGIVVNKSDDTTNPAAPGNTAQAGAIAIGSNSQGSVESVSIGTTAAAKSQYSIAVGYNSSVSGVNSIALGANTKVPGFENSVALGYGSLADDDNVVSVGSGKSADKDSYQYRRIINVADGVSSHDAVTLGQLQNNYYDINQIDEKFETLGGASSGTGSVDLSDYAKTADVVAALGDMDFTGTNYIDSATDLTDATKKLDTQVKANADALETKANKADVYTKDEVYNKTEIDSMIHTSANVDGINRKLEKLGTRLEKVGAGAAALAALHPLDYDPDDKLTFSAGMGNYAGENAAALGAFYRPNEKFMLSLGGTLGNGENMVNLGLSIGLDKPNGFAKMSKRELIQKVNVMEAKYESVEAENEAMKDQLTNADERIAKLEALVAQLVAK